MQLTLILLFTALALIFGAGFVIIITLDHIPEIKKQQAWKPAVMSVLCAIAAMVAAGCL